MLLTVQEVFSSWIVDVVIVFFELDLEITCWDTSLMAPRCFNLHLLDGNILYFKQTRSIKHTILLLEEIKQTNQTTDLTVRKQQPLVAFIYRLVIPP